jgi:hypothetical protein
MSIARPSAGEIAVTIGADLRRVSRECFACVAISKGRARHGKPH